MPPAESTPAPEPDPPVEPAVTGGPVPRTSPDTPIVAAFGDDAVLVDLRVPAGIRGARRAQALARSIDALRAGSLGSGGAAGTHLGAPVPGAASVLVPFDPAMIDASGVADLLAELLAGLPPDPAPPPDAREHVIAVRYGGADGPDLADVALATGLTEAQVVELHAATPYEVMFLGFAPGFAYLGELPDRLVLPRLATPRTRVPAGSVAIADRLTAAYPAASPGGWRLLGRTDVVLFDPAAEPPVLLRPGDRVRFAPR